MISLDIINKFEKQARWQDSAQIEQDLIISRALVDLYQNEHIKKTLVFRGGTALNKLFLNPASRYSEDIDLVQIKSSAIGETIDAIRSALHWLGKPQRLMTKRCVKLIYKYLNVNGLNSKLKIEINTTEHFQVLPLEYKNLEISSEWFYGSSKISTYHVNELMGTKLRALYQRRKGRDLFDLWHTANLNLIEVEKVIEIFGKYCDHNKIKITKRDFIESLEEKKQNRDFKMDMNLLLPINSNWDFDHAYDYVMKFIVEKIS